MPAETRKKMALLGGTFNPPHRAHVELAEHAVRVLGIDRVVVMPAADPPHKEVDGGLSADLRHELARLAFGGLPGVEVSDLELRRPGKSYTIDTLAELRAQNPGWQISLICGQDMFVTLESWYKGEELLRTTPILVFPRPEDGLGDAGEVTTFARRYQALYQTEVTVADFPLRDVSSTDLRHELAHELLPTEIPAEVLWFIADRGLYGLRLDESRAKTERERALLSQLSAVLDRHRLWHSIGVMEEMERLARRFGYENLPLARLAGLLHDCTKNENTQKQLRLCQEFDIMISNLERSAPRLLHAVTGEPVARARYGLTEQEALFAIRYHTTGRAGMSLLEKLLYLADYVEPLRSFPGVEPVRRVLRDQGLEPALLLALKNTIAELTERDSPIHPDTLAAYNDCILRRES
ncbi:MAG: nicotinate (nicotinamide) nucleotide adenylyltransferase [Clostridia bacterium]|nr:nicotinate (nicotinamide) nucleotide adenylyltransferase [Clostridia bacterium]MBQ3078134.1 nicotinate (nicotinamide) nucleotide adenylyltransferase [Clostridia bacterium]